MGYQGESSSVSSSRGSVLFIDFGLVPSPASGLWLWLPNQWLIHRVTEMREAPGECKWWKESKQEKRPEGAQRSGGELGWRRFFGARVVATIAESGNLGEEIDI